MMSKSSSRAQVDVFEVLCANLTLEMLEQSAGRFAHLPPAIGPDGVADHKPIPYLEFVEVEIAKLLCTQNQEYSALRRKINALAGKGEAGILAAISGVVGSKAGPIAGSVFPIVALVLRAALATTKAAWCKFCEEQGRIPKTVPKPKSRRRAAPVA